jgi:hypothetical protein
LTLALASERRFRFDHFRATETQYHLSQSISEEYTTEWKKAFKSPTTWVAAAIKSICADVKHTP